MELKDTGSWSFCVPSTIFGGQQRGEKDAQRANGSCEVVKHRRIPNENVNNLKNHHQETTSWEDYVQQNSIKQETRRERME